MNFKKMLAFLLVAVLLIIGVVGCGPKEEDKQDYQDNSTSEGEKDDDNSTQTDEDSESNEQLTIGFNNFLKGVYSLDILEKSFLSTCEALDVKPMVVNDEGKVENSTRNIDNMIASGVDGIVFFGISDTLFPVVAQKCEDADIPYVFYDHMPTDEILASIQDNPNYLGVAATVDLNTGNNIGEYAAEQNLKKAIVVTGQTTDTTHSARTNGFKETFESSGGEVLAEGYGEVVISEAMARADDLLTAHPDADCIYATNGDVGTACMEVLEKHPEVNAKLFVTDLDPDVLDGLKEGKIEAANGAHWVNVNFATALLVNHLNGNTIKDTDGKPPRLVVPVMTLPSNMVDLYNKYWIETLPYSAEELQSIVAPWNENANIDDFQQMLDDYTIEKRLQAKVDAGILTQEELDEVLD